MTSPTPLRKPEITAIVRLPTCGPHSYLQTVVGKTSSVSSDLEEFRGIPFGTVSGRWEHSQLRTHLPQDVFIATRNGPKCPQPSAPNNSRTYQSYLPFPDDVAESEFDCLNLFIIRPSQAALERQGFDVAKTRLPVLIWIHGGGWAFGAATDPMWDPSRIVLRALHRGSPIVAICINYRLNIFGFAASTDILRSQDPTRMQGLNFGLRDQKVALEWISRNIATFGGDPDRLTLGGQSAGSASVHGHLLEAELGSEKPLFRRAIMQSGALGTLGPDSLEVANKTWADLCKHWGVEAEASESERVALLRRIQPQALVESVEALQLGSFSAVFDDITFLSGTPVDANIAINLGPIDVRNGFKPSCQTRIDVLIGVTDWEAGIFLSSPASWEQIRRIFDQSYSDSFQRAEVMQAYNLVESASHEDLQNALILFLNDSMFEIPVHRARTLLNKRRCMTGNPEATGVHSFHVEFGNPFSGPNQSAAHHCVELVYLFEAFHDALVKADQGILGPYNEPSDLGTVDNTFIDSAGPDAEFDSSRGKDKHPSEPSKGYPYIRTNIELCHALQDCWLDFIVLEEYLPGSSSDRITVYGRDRGTRTESLSDDAHWQRKRQRWGLAERDLDAMTRAARAVRAL